MKKHGSKIFLFLFLISIILPLPACEREKAKEISLKENLVKPEATKKTYALRLAVGAIISPKNTYIYYKEILDYISVRMRVPVELVQRDTYEAVNQLIKNNEIDAAFVCSGAYVDGNRDFGMELLLAPQAYGETCYYSYIIVPNHSNVKKIEDLKGKKFAFTDPMSNSGKLIPTYILSKMGYTPQNFFSTYIFTYSHDKSIEAVANKLVDGAAVDSLIWEYINQINPALTSKAKIIQKSDPCGIPPLVVPKELNPIIKKNLKNILINMHTDPEGKKILDKIKIDRFVEIDDSAYDSIREMGKWIKAQEKTD